MKGASIVGYCAVVFWPCGVALRQGSVEQGKAKAKLRLRKAMLAVALICVVRQRQRVVVSRTNVLSDARAKLGRTMRS